MSQFIPLEGGFVQSSSAADGNSLAQRGSSGEIVFGQVTASSLITLMLRSVPTTKTTTFSATVAAMTYLCSAASGYAATLPAASAYPGIIFIFKKTDNNANAITVTAAGADTIESGTTVALSSQWAKTMLQSDGVSNWIKLV